MQTENSQLDDSRGAWRILDIDGVRRISNQLITEILESVYNYSQHSPVVLIPISRSSALILSEYWAGDRLSLRIHDIRIMGDLMSGSISFIIRGDQVSLKRFRNEMARTSDETGCIGIGFFLRKLFYNGFGTIMKPKVLKKNMDSSLRGVQTVIKEVLVEGGK